jgi:hypothetical protein
VALGFGDGAFSAPIEVVVGTNPQGVIVVDLNADGLDDIVTANFGSDNVSVLLSLGHP